MQGDAHPTKVALRERRDRVIARLTESFARDELGIDAFEARIDAAYCGRSQADFDALVADLPPPDRSEEAAIVVAREEEPRHALTTLDGPTVRVESRSPVRALFSNIESEPSVMPRATELEAIFGHIELDLRRATFAPGITEVRVKAIFGSIEIGVPADIRVEVSGSGIFGNFQGASRAIADPDAPTLRIVGTAVFSSVEVKTLPPLRVQQLVEQVRARLLFRP
jgi:cell wall-active antibiotic response 4TMS protein YvqF/uncharacterized protein DUF1707